MPAWTTPGVKLLQLCFKVHQAYAPLSGAQVKLIRTGVAYALVLAMPLLMLPVVRSCLQRWPMQYRAFRSHHIVQMSCKWQYLTSLHYITSLLYPAPSLFLGSLCIKQCALTKQKHKLSCGLLFLGEGQLTTSIALERLQHLLDDHWRTQSTVDRLSKRMEDTRRGKVDNEAVIR